MTNKRSVRVSSGDGKPLRAACNYSSTKRRGENKKWIDVSCLHDLGSIQNKVPSKARDISYVNAAIVLGAGLDHGVGLSILDGIGPHCLTFLAAKSIN
jgi:hypothetical protein